MQTHPPTPIPPHTYTHTLIHRSCMCAQGICVVLVSDWTTSDCESWWVIMHVHVFCESKYTNLVYAYFIVSSESRHLHDLETERHSYGIWVYNGTRVTELCRSNLMSCLEYSSIVVLESKMAESNNLLLYFCALGCGNGVRVMTKTANHCWKRP